MNQTSTNDMNFIEKYLFSVPQQEFDLLEIKRWNGLFTFRKETVAEHVHVVSFFASILSRTCFEPLNDSWIVSLLYDILFESNHHDNDENESNDVSYYLKYNEFNGAEIGKCIKKFNENQFVDFLKLDQSDDTRRIYCDTVLSKNVGFVKLFVKMCDWLSSIQFLNREVLLGNKLLEQKRKDTMEASLPFIQAVIYEGKRLYPNNFRPEYLNSLIESIKTSI